MDLYRRSASAHQTTVCACAGRPFPVETCDPSYVVRCLAVTDGPHTRSPVPRVSGTKVTPDLGCFDRHRAGLARARTCHPPPLPTIDPMREGSVLSLVQTERPHSSWWKTSTGSSASWTLRSWSKDDRVVAGGRSSREKPTHPWPFGRPRGTHAPTLTHVGHKSTRKERGL